MAPLRLMVKTEDRQLYEAIKAIERDDIKFSNVAFDAVPSATEAAFMFIFTISSSVTAGLILKLLKDYLSKKRAEKTTINGIGSQNNFAPVFIEINNYIQKQKIDEDKGENDDGAFEIIESGGVKYYGKKIKTISKTSQKHPADTE